jgi:two-component system, sensor histidine kinase LadS
MKVSMQPATVRLPQILLVFLMLACLLSSAPHAQALTLKANDTKINLTPNVQVFADPTGELTLAQIQADPDRFVFKSVPPGTNVLAFGFTDAAYWVRFELTREPNAPERWILEIPYVGIDDIQWHGPNDVHAASGTMRDASERQIFARVHAFYVDVSAQPQTYYLRVKSSYSLTVPLELMRTDVYGRQQLIDTMFQFLYYGGLLSLLLYNLMIFLTNRDWRYLVYCFFIVFAWMGMFAGNGYGRLFLWPDWQHFDRISQGLFFSLGGIFAFLFTGQFLRLRERAKWVHKSLMLGIVVFVGISASMLASAITDISVNLLYMLLFWASSFGTLVCLGVSIYLAVWQRVREASYFVVSWGFLFTGAIIATLRAFELLPSNVFTLYAMQISSGFEALFFSFALADRLRTERHERELAQQRLVKSQQETVEALKISEDRLESAVDVRTQELRAILVKEQRVREQYVRFGAMIAHEFRNPLNVIEAQSSLFEIDPTADSTKVAKRVGVVRSAVTRLANLFDQWLQSDRLSQAFARITPLPIDTIGLIDDVVTSSRTYQPDHQILNYSTEAPLVIRADYSLLRMALLNLVDNACKYSPKESTVCVGVELRNDWVGLFVRDEGSGIPLEKQKEIFEPYFQLPNTERLVGVGLGLSFVKRIAELHEGRVELYSRPRHGSTFTIWVKRYVGD